jgi:hypothetical protein
MFSAFIGGFMSFMGMYTAYKVIRSGIIRQMVQNLRQEPTKPEVGGAWQAHRKPNWNERNQG